MRFGLCLPGIPPTLIEKREFYRADREVLSRIGPTSVSTSLLRVPDEVDVAFSWWWYRSFPLAADARRRRIPIIVTGATNVDNWYQSKPKAHFKRLLDRSCAELASANLAISRTEAELLHSHGYPRVHVLPLAVEVPFLTPPHDNTRDPCLLVTIAHLSPISVTRKGVVRSVATLAQVADRDARLVIVGEDQGSRQAVRRYAEHLGVGDRVAFAGSIDRASKRSLLWRATAYLQMSTNEGFGVAVVEAMAAKCPVIVAPLSALIEVTGNAAFAYPTCPKEAAEAIDELNTATERRAEAVRRCFDRAQREYDYDVRASRLRDLLHSPDLRPSSADAH